MRTLIENLQFVVTVDKANRVLRGASVAIAGDRIEAIGPGIGRAGFDRVVDGSRYGMTPGFIDAHVHLGETLSRAVFPDSLPTMEWVFNWAKPFYAHTDARDELVGSQVALAEMLRCGTTCFLDMGAHNDVAGIVAAIERSGMRGITGRHAADVRPPSTAGWDEEMLAHHYFPSAKAALTALERVVKDHHGAAGGRVRAWINVEGKEPSTSLELHVGARALAEKLGVGASYHLATSNEEAKATAERYGATPVKRIASNGGLGDNLVIAHCVAVTDEEIELMARAGTAVAFCPAASIKLGKGATRIGRYPEMLAAGMRVGLGTDGVSAGGTLSLMRQMYLVAAMFKDARMDTTMLGAQKALRMATIDAAQMLGWADEIGSLEPGKKADFVLFDLEHFEWLPYGDPVQALVYSASPASIAETWVDGRALYRDGAVQTLDETRLRIEACERARAIARRAGLNS